MLHRIAEDTDSIARIIRRLVTAAYTDRYCIVKPPRADLKHDVK